MDKFDVAVGLVAVVFIALVLNGLWSIVNAQTAYCGVLTGYVLLGALAGASLLLSRWYRQLETIGAGLALLYLLVMWITFLNPGTLQYC
ncbi:hypothetical protein [Pyrobaculum ferrireducens]|uniref:Uncharacterized protein n=1 Tax=Pyrobaculum ferrireducens TaxID=1104324 RepID=G7VCL7_9CREN|nr:hypothetical protein [Pyrobaculum ferrireducens]AET33822.1 hypothetical protein P186_2436 [Pyrobaculum ferrireducens]